MNTTGVPGSYADEESDEAKAHQTEFRNARYALLCAIKREATTGNGPNALAFAQAWSTLVTTDSVTKGG